MARYVRRRRLERACRDLLLAGVRGTPLTAIAHHCGFPDAGALGRAFRATYGMTPSHYRAQQRGPVERLPPS